MRYVHLTQKSSNKKTGPIPVSTSTFNWCPDVCPFKRNGCYADGGPQAIHWRKVTAGERGLPWADFLAAIQALPAGQLWRHNVSGDLPGTDGRLDSDMVAGLVAANEGRRGFTYTHYAPTPHNLAIIATANRRGFTVNLSANNLQHADQLADTGAGPVTVVLPADQQENTTTPAGRRVVVCPAVTRDNVSCATCKLCAVRDRAVIVGFPAHGSGKRKADAVAKN